MIKAADVTLLCFIWWRRGGGVSHLLFTLISKENSFFFCLFDQMLSSQISY